MRWVVRVEEAVVRVEVAVEREDRVAWAVLRRVEEGILGGEGRGGWKVG